MARARQLAVWPPNRARSRIGSLIGCLPVESVERCMGRANRSGKAALGHHCKPTRLRLCQLCIGCDNGQCGVFTRSRQFRQPYDFGIEWMKRPAPAKLGIPLHVPGKEHIGPRQQQIASTIDDSESPHCDPEFRDMR